MTSAAAPIRIHTLIDSLTWGGAETLLADLAAEAPTAGIDLSVGYLREVDRSPAARRLRDAGVEPLLVDTRARLDVGSLRQVRAHLASVRPDLVHTHLATSDVLGGVAARSLGIPSVCTVHTIGAGYGYASGARGAARTALVALARRHASARVLAVSHAARDAYLGRHRELPERVITVHNGLARTRARRPRDVVRAELGLSADAVIATMVTVLRPGKGHEIALDAIARLRDRLPALKLVIVGDGPSRAEVAALAAPLGPAALMLGHRDDVMDLLGATDVVLHPTTMDAFPTVLLEAGAAGLPAIATRVGGVTEIVEHGETGLLVNAPPTAGPVAAALEALVTDPARRARLGAAARRRFESSFTAERWATRLRRVYDEVLAERRRAGSFASGAVCRRG